MTIQQSVIKCNPLYKILNLIKSNFPELFLINSFGRPRKYKVGNILAFMIYKSRISNLSFRKIANFLKNDFVALKILGFDKVPDFTILFKIYKKYLEKNINIFLKKIGTQLCKNEYTFYLDSSSLVTSKFDKEAKVGKSTRINWYYGYKLHLICSRKGIPISFNITTANIHDSKCEELITSLGELNQECDVIADKGYDTSKLLKHAKEHGIKLICPLNKRKAKKIELENIKCTLRKENYVYLETREGKSRYSKRWEIERLFGNLKENYSIDNHRVRGLSRKYMNVSFKLLLFTIEKVTTLLKIIFYFCNTLYRKL